MDNLTIAGVDPGVVHTGTVVLEIDVRLGTVHSWSRAFDRAPATEIADHLHGFKPDSIYIEDYNPRQNFNNDVRMVQAVGSLRQAMPRATVVDNAASTTLVTRDLMELLGVWNFNTPTHHQDLRSAARIALFGMLKNKDGQREFLSDLVHMYLKGRKFDVQRTEY